ncbi:MAG: PcfJ domain-containing protein [Candidatus Berkelbacteria bacterium]|nr:PcfJ domain-containing protein [Candidatus Berkelbacteria bacterium]
MPEQWPENPIYSPETEYKPNLLKLSDEEKSAINAITLGIEEVDESVREMAVSDVIRTLENGHPLNKVIVSKEGEVAAYLAFEDFLPREAYIKYFGTNGQLGRNFFREIPAFFEYAKQHGYTKLNFHGWNKRLNHILERLGFTRLRTDSMGEFSVDFYEKMLTAEKTAEEVGREREHAFEQKYLAKIRNDYEQTLNTFSEEMRAEKEQTIDDAFRFLSTRLQNTDGFDFNQRAEAILKLKLARYFQNNEAINLNTIYDAVIETPRFLQCDKGSLFHLFEIHQQKTLEKIAENRKKRAEMDGKERFNPYEALFTTKSGHYYLARLLNMPHLEEESNYMNHCVGTSDSYVNQMKRGDIEILSFRTVPPVNSEHGISNMKVDVPIITIEYNLRTKTIEQMKKYDDGYLQPSDPYYDDVVDALEKMRSTETDTGDLRDFKKISDSELSAIPVPEYCVLTKNGEADFRDFDPESGEFILKIGEMPILPETPKTDVAKIVRIMEGIKVGEDQIALNQEEILKTTKLYIGPLFPEIFQKYPNIDNIFTSFPEGKIRRAEDGIGGKSKDTLKQELKEKKINIGSFAEDMIESQEFTTQENREQITTIRLKVRDLGFSNGATTEEIYNKATEFGLELCPAELALHRRLADENQAMNDWYVVAMKPISGRDGGPDVFNLNRNSDGLWLDNHWANSTNPWDSGRGFLFRLRKDS